MSDNIRSGGSRPSFSEVYQKFQSNVAFLQDGEHLVAEGEQLYVQSNWATSWEPLDERQERWRAGADHVRAAIDREYGPGLGDVIFSRLSSAAGHRLRDEVTRGDLEQINSLLGKSTAAWDSVTGSTYKDTAAKAEKLGASGLHDVRNFGKELAELRDNVMWGASHDLPTKWVSLSSRIDEASRKADLVQAHNQELRSLAPKFERIESHFLSNVAPGFGRAAPVLMAMEEEFRAAVRKVHQESTTEDADRLANLRQDAIDKGNKLQSAVDARVQVWEQAAKSLSLDDTANKIEVLAGWPEKRVAAEGLYNEFRTMRATAVGTGAVDSAGLKEFRQRVDKILSASAEEIRHQATVRSLTTYDDATAHIAYLVDINAIPDSDEESDSEIPIYLQKPAREQEKMAALRDAIADWRDAAAKATPMPAKSGIGYEPLHDTATLRKNLRAAEDNLRTVYESGLEGDPPAAYLIARANDIAKANQTLVLRAGMIPDAGDDVIALQHRLDTAREAVKDTSLPAQKRYDSALEMVSIANKLTAIGSTTVTPVQTTGTVTSTALHQQVGQLTEVAGKISALPGSGPGAWRADEAQKLVNAAAPQALAQLSDKAKAGLLDSLFSADSFPKSSRETRDDPMRTALRKLYAATALDPAFVVKDNVLREHAVEILVARHGKEFFFYRENWSIMTDDQRMRALNQALEAHCAALDIPSPTLVKNTDRDTGAAGAYDRRTNAITICASNSAFADFESMMDTIFHENTHCYQESLVRQLSRRREHEFEDQFMIIAANKRGENAYVRGQEDMVGYKRQPIEAHAWLAGSHASSLLRRRLDALGTSGS